MNKAAKILLIVSLSLLAVGGAIFGVGLAMGGTLSYGFAYVDGKVVYTNSDTNKNETKELQSFKKVQVNTSVIDIIIKKGDKFEISYDLPESFVPSYEIKNDTLYVSTDNHSFSFNFGFLFNKNNAITITVPQNDSLDYVEIEGSTADITLEDLNASGKIKLSTGALLLKNINGKRLDCETSTGSISFYNVKSNDIRVETSTGNFYGEMGDWQKEYDFEFKTSTGDILGLGFFADHYIANKVGNPKFISIKTSTGDICIN